MKYTLLIASFLVSIPFSIFAENSNVLSVQEKVSINAPASKVWDLVSKFGDLGAWHPAVKSTKIVSGFWVYQDSSKKKVGTVRTLTLLDGSIIKEKLLAYNSKGKTLKYSILGGVLPVSDYISTLTVKAVSNEKSVVVWESNFKRKDGSDDVTAIKTITSVYRMGLDNLKNISEAVKSTEIVSSTEIAFGSFKFKPFVSTYSKERGTTEAVKSTEIVSSTEIAFGSFKFKPFVSTYSKERGTTEAVKSTEIVSSAEIAFGSFKFKPF